MAMLFVLVKISAAPQRNYRLNLAGNVFRASTMVQYPRPAATVPTSCRVVGFRLDNLLDGDVSGSAAQCNRQKVVLMAASTMIAATVSFAVPLSQVDTQRAP
ncbi:hypothetical protein ACQ3I4_15465 [Zafaria sp. Z1313]|uniref:hypothetical protein n=2 Tax=unclassified Zafaria TaxID=2828765 RepID=UPI003D3036EC